MISAGIRQMADVNFALFSLSCKTEAMFGRLPDLGAARTEQKFAKWQIEFTDIFFAAIWSIFRQCNSAKKSGLTCQILSRHCALHALDGQGKTRNAQYV
jgi:hypothetical protein